jgi:hypothetical protein
MKKLPKYVAMTALALAATAALPSSQLWAQDRGDRDTRPADGRLMADDLPDDVRRTIERQARGTNHFVDRRERDGNERYTVHYTTDDGQRMVMRLDERGRVVEEPKPALVQPKADREDPSDEGVQFREVQEKDVPERVRRAMEKYTDGSRDALYNRQIRGGKTFYSVHYTTPQGERMWVRVAENGELAAGPNINVTKGIGLASAEGRDRDRDRDRDRPRDRRDRPDRPRPTEQVRQQEITAADLPADIRRVIEKETAGGAEHRFVRETRGNEVTYFVEYTKDGQRANLRLDDRGRVLGEQAVAGDTPRPSQELRREELSAADLPADIRRVIEQETAGGSEHKFVRESRGDEVTYFVEYTKDGKRGNLRLDDRGRVLGEQEVAGATPPPSQEMRREELNASQLPADVRRTVEQETAGATDHRFIREAQGDQVSYFVEYTKDGQRGNLRVDERGKVLGEQEVAGAPRPAPRPAPQPADDDDAQVAAARDTSAHQMVEPGELPAEVRQAIEQQTKGGSNHLFQRHTNEGQTLYTAHYATADGDYNIIVLDDAGRVLVEPRPSRWLEGRKGVKFEALGPEQLPAEVRQTIEKQAPRATEHLFVRRVRPDAEPTYLVQFTNARGRRMQMEVNANGEVREEPGAAREEPFRLIERKQDRQ